MKINKKLIGLLTGAMVLTTSINVGNDVQAYTKENNNTTNEYNIDDEYSKCNDYVFVTNDVNLRSKDSVQSKKMGTIKMYDKVYRLASNGTWDLVKYNNKKGYIKECYTHKLPKTYVEVDISSQKVKFYKNNKLIIKSNVVTGTKDKTPTHLGWFSMYGRRHDTYLNGPGYSVHVDYWMPFDGGIGLHDAYWRDGVFGGDIYKTNGSHGCVNLPHKTAETIYENTSNGSKVLVHR